jgi:hypothetical protein
VVSSNFAAPKGVDSDADADSLSDGIDIDRRLRGPGDCNVSSPAEKRFDLHYRAANAGPVEEIAGPWHGDGGEHAQDADSDDELEDCERVSHSWLSFRRISWLNSI